MSSYDPSDESDDGSSFDPGVQESEISDYRGVPGRLSGLDRTQYILLGIVLSIPAGILTAFLVMEIFPAYHETAGKIVHWVGERIADIFLTNLGTSDASSH
jgi:hypothetical protein